MGATFYKLKLLEYGCILKFQQSSSNEVYVFICFSHVIPSDKLDSEAVLYWKCMCAHFTSLEVRGEEQMDKVLPSVSDFCDYIHT